MTPGTRPGSAGTRQPPEGRSVPRRRVLWPVLTAAGVAASVSGVAAALGWAKPGSITLSHAPRATVPATGAAAIPRPTPSAPSPSPSASGPGLSAAQLAGQRVILSYDGQTPPDALLAAIRRGEAAGVIFFGPNIASASQIAQVIQELNGASASRANPLRHLPLLLMTDQEGGLVRRMPGAPLLSEKQIGESAHPAAAAARAGSGAAHNLASVGMNVNLAPVLDVERSPEGFDGQFGRSYSGNPHLAARLGTAFIKAQQAAGVAATAKHFPGLGAAGRSQNTDERPVTLHVPLRKLRGVDELPFRTAIAAGVKLVMVSWAVYPALDQLPAGLSPRVVTGELRHRLGYRGVTITDALEAGALTHIGPVGRRATLAARAGMDLMLSSGQQVGEGDAARGALMRGYRDGALSRPVFEATVQRILALRASLAH